jgi:hypothetical protein
MITGLASAGVHRGVLCEVPVTCIICRESRDQYCMKQGPRIIAAWRLCIYIITQARWTTGEQGLVEHRHRHLLLKGYLTNG